MGMKIAGSDGISGPSNMVDGQGYGVMVQETLENLCEDRIWMDIEYSR